MKSIFKIIASLLLFSALAFPVALTAENIAASTQKGRLLYLVAGLDDAAENTDALLIVSFNTRDNTAAIVQLPRDTYVNVGDKKAKINSLYSSSKIEGLTSKKAMKKTSDFVGSALGISLDGYIAITTDSFSRAIDALGGVTVSLVQDFVHNDKDPGKSFVLRAGENTLDGRQSLIFVRHRKSYLTADLGRLDAQKIFISGLYNTAMKKAGRDELMASVKELRKGSVTDFSLMDLLVILLKHSSKFRDTEITYLTMPGEAVADESGKWYYVLNRAATEKVIKKYFSSDEKVFDSKRVFLNDKNSRFAEIYNRQSFTFKEYQSDNLNGIIIPKA